MADSSATHKDKEKNQINPFIWGKNFSFSPLLSSMDPASFLFTGQGENIFCLHSLIGRVPQIYLHWSGQLLHWLAL